MSGDVGVSWRARSVKIGAGLAVMVVLCAVSGYLMLLEFPSSVTRAEPPCTPAPDEPAKLAGEAVFQRMPTGASSASEPYSQQPCEVDESDDTGAVTVWYRGKLSDKEIRAHYEAVARESGWVSDVPEGGRLVFAKKSLRDRCLWFSVQRDAAGRPDYYTVDITFFPKHDDFYCKD